MEWCRLWSYVAGMGYEIPIIDFVRLIYRGDLFYRNFLLHTHLTPSTVNENVLSE